MKAFDPTQATPRQKEPIFVLMPCSVNEQKSTINIKGEFMKQERLKYESVKQKTNVSHYIILVYLISYMYVVSRGSTDSA